MLDMVRRTPPAYRKFERTVKFLIFLVAATSRLLTVEITNDSINFFVLVSYVVLFGFMPKYVEELPITSTFQDFPIHPHTRPMSRRGGMRKDKQIKTRGYR